MAYPDRLMYNTLLLLEAAATGRYSDYREVDILIAKSGVDPEHIAWQLATMLAPVIRQRPGWKHHLERDIAAAKLLADADLDSEHDNEMFINTHNQ